MAIDPRISLQVQAPQVSQAINIFENALMNKQTRNLRASQEARAAELQPFRVQQQQQNIDINQQNIDKATDQRILKSINDFAVTNQHIIDEAERSGDFGALQQAMVQRRAQLVQSGLPTDETDEGILMLGQGDIQSLDVIDQLRNSRQLFNQQSGQRAKQFALQSNAPITDPITGQVSTPVFNPATGETQLVPIKGAIQETITQKADRQQKAKVKEAELEVKTTKRVADIKRTATRTSALKKEFGDRRRLAARSTRKIKEAQKLAEKATQGLGGVAKVQLGRIFPGIDTGNEAALTGAFKNLALDELQKFTGPTTDFEFRVTEDIAGSLGDGASANKARLSSMERAAWFNDRESQQFNDHIKGGHDPDEFFFNFNELVTPRKGGKSYSLQSLQDTAVFNHISIDEVIKRLGK